MKLLELSVKEFVEILGSNAPAPGGGSASALAAAMGVSLTKMVAELTQGKKQYAQHADVIENILKTSASQQQELLIAVDKDTEAFNAVSAVFKMPKETDEQQANRREAMQKALEGAVQSPYAMMEISLNALTVAKSAVGKSNLNALSDLGVAVLNLKSGLQGAWLNVLINLSGIKNKEFVDYYRSSGEKILSEGCQLADEIYNQILNNLEQ